MAEVHRVEHSRVNGDGVIVVRSHKLPLFRGLTKRVPVSLAKSRLTNMGGCAASPTPPHEPHLRDLATTPRSAFPGLSVPAQVQGARHRGVRRDVKLHGLVCLGQERM